MHKKYYTDFAQHCLRFYARYSYLTDFSSSIDKDNWEACQKVLNEQTEANREILLYIYREPDTIPDNVYQVSQKFRRPQMTIWKMMQIVERAVAEERGLV